MNSTIMLSRAMGHLAKGSCSESLLCTLLEQEFANEPNLQQKIKETVLRLHQLNLINDERIACSIAERYSHKGDSVIIHHLNHLGIDKIHAQLALNSIGTEYQRALCEAQILYTAYRDLERNELQNRIMRLLSSRYFAYQTLRLVMDALFNKDVLISTFQKVEKENLFKTYNHA